MARGKLKVFPSIFDPGAEAPTGPSVNYNIYPPGTALPGVPAQPQPQVHEPPQLGVGPQRDRITALEFNTASMQQKQVSLEMENMRLRMINEAQFAGYRFQTALVTGNTTAEVNASIARAVDIQKDIEKQAELRAEQRLLQNGLIQRAAPSQPMAPVGYTSAPAPAYPQQQSPSVPQYRAAPEPVQGAQGQQGLAGMSTDEQAYALSPAATRDAVVDPATGRLGLTTYEKYRNSILASMQGISGNPQFPAQYSVAPAYVPQQQMQTQPVYGPPPQVNPAAMNPQASPMNNGYAPMVPQMLIQAPPPPMPAQFQVPPGYMLVQAPPQQPQYQQGPQLAQQPQQMVQQTIQSGQTFGTQTDQVLGQMLQQYHNSTGIPPQQGFVMAQQAAQNGLRN